MNTHQRLLRLSFVIMLGIGLATTFAGCDKDKTADATPAQAAATVGDIVALKPSAEALAGIVVEPIPLRILARTVAAQGEVRSDRYRSAQITPRVAAQVVRRLVKLGDTVKAGQSLVILSSVEVAEAQGNAMLKRKEWERVRELGETVVGARRFLEAKVAAEQAQAKLAAYGVSPSKTQSTQGLGQFTLVATRAGTILSDDFIEGERVEPGRVLFLIADESTSWVEAHLSPADANRVAQGSKARIKVGGHWLDGTVIQKHHLLNEATRTIPLRIEIKPVDEHIHDGEFVECRLAVGTIDNAMAVPNTALYQGIDGSWAVFVKESAGRYRRVPVTIKEDLGEQSIVDGLTPGAVVVTQGAFFLNSELAKASFGDE